MRYESPVLEGPHVRVALYFAALSVVASCESYPLIATSVQLPPGIRADPTQLHLETASGTDFAFAPKLEPAGFSEIHPAGDHFEVLFPTRIGTATFTYARVWLDLNGDGVLDGGDAVGELSPAPFRATDRGMFSCATNQNVAPSIVLKPKP